MESFQANSLVLTEFSFVLWPWLLEHEMSKKLSCTQGIDIYPLIIIFFTLLSFLFGIVWYLKSHLKFAIPHLNIFFKIIFIKIFKLEN